MYSSYWSQRYWTWEGLGITGAEVPPEVKTPDVTQQHINASAGPSNCMTAAAADQMRSSSLSTTCNPGYTTKMDVTTGATPSEKPEVIKAGWNPTNDPGTPKLKNMTSSSTYLGHLLVGKAIIPTNEGLSLLKKKQEELARNRKTKSKQNDDVTDASLQSVTSAQCHTPVTSPLYINTQGMSVDLNPSNGVTSPQTQSTQQPRTDPETPQKMTSVYSASRPKPFRAQLPSSDVTSTDKWLTSSFQNGGLGQYDVKSRTAPVSPASTDEGGIVRMTQQPGFEGSKIGRLPEEVSWIFHLPKQAAISCCLFIGPLLGEMCSTSSGQSLVLLRKSV